MKIASRLCLALTVLAATALPFDFTGLKPQGYVSDFANVVDAGSRAELEQYCASVEAATGAQIALVTIETLNGEPVEDVANSLFRKWGIGHKGKDDGILLLLVTRDRRSRLEVGYGLEPLIPDGFAGGLLREMRPALRQGQYGDALIAAAQVIGSRIAEAKGVEIGASLPQRRRPQSDSLPWPLLLGGIVLLLFLLGAGGRGGGFGGFLTGMFLGNLLGGGRGSGGGGSGGFGGFDSGGGGFGGFGGGDSGGGGASGGW